MTPDERRAYPSEVEKEVASIPYNDLVKSFENDPESFTESVPALEPCLRYIKAFALLAAWENVSPGNWYEKLDKEISVCRSREPDSSDTKKLRANRLVDSANTFVQEIALLAKQSLIGAAWREYRMSFDPEKMKAEQRIAVFIDEVVAHYSSIEKHRELDGLDAGSPDSLFKFINGINLDDTAYKYTGWAYLAKGILGVWSGHSLEEILRCFGKTDEKARIDRDYALKYQLLKAVDNLLPVLKSNLYLDSLEGMFPKYCSMRYDPMHRDIDTTKIDPWHILKYFEDSIGNALGNHLRDEYRRMDTAIIGLFNNRGQLKASATEVARVWNSYQQSHLLDERHRIKSVSIDDRINDSPNLDGYIDPVLVQWGKIQFALGVSAYDKGDSTTSSNYARVLSSIASVATRETWYATVGYLLNWHEQLVVLNNIKN